MGIDLQLVPPGKGCWLSEPVHVVKDAFDLWSYILPMVICGMYGRPGIDAQLESSKVEVLRRVEVK